MKELLPHLPKKPSKKHLLYAVIVVAVCVYGMYLYASLHKQYLLSQSKIAELETTLKGVEDNFSNMKIEKDGLQERLVEEQDLNNSLKSANKKISRTVSTLKKLTETDPELLKKYSKVYFLNENYAPPKLVSIDSRYLFDKNKPQEILDNVSDYLDDLLDEAENDRVTLQIISAYRSFGIQANLKSSYSVIYGAGSANQFSADQGYSEHQLGTAVDFITPAMNGALTVAFENTPEYEWLTRNAYKYGFILSYPKGNSYYQFEPWHFRFVGKDLAHDLNRDHKNFYDLDQRELDDYLVKIFD
ncbi:MAG: M15 family metallopeptidase [Candidatus Taylorbacteria bacterium]